MPAASTTKRRPALHRVKGVGGPKRNDQAVRSSERATGNSRDLYHSRSILRMQLARQTLMITKVLLALSVKFQMSRASCIFLLWPRAVDSILRASATDLARGA